MVMEHAFQGIIVLALIINTNGIVTLKPLQMYSRPYKCYIAKFNQEKKHPKNRYTCYRPVALKNGV